MSEYIGFNPDWISPPGDTMVDILAERQISTSDFARQMGQSPRHAQQLLQGQLEITPELAQQLEAVLGAPASFWATRESQYRNAVVRLEQESKRQSATQWLKELPLKDMLNFGWINKLAANMEEACLDFFGVTSIDEWKNTNQALLQAVAFRTSPSYKQQAGAVSAWLRKGELEANLIDTKPWDASRFTETLPDIRTLTRKADPQVFIPELRRLCAGCGVAVVTIRAPQGCRASGATRFLTPEKALLLLSFRHLSDDHFWFSFFHEAGHLLLHSKKSLFIEESKMTASKEEDEANEFAARALIPLQYETELLGLSADERGVMKFSRRIGIARGIVVGQLQHRRIIKRNQLNNLKTRYTWGDDNSPCNKI
jgi:plasmid maintenance system antidote protein VapI/Zn-dependent peptidase ImmA (M78 family)